MLFLQAIKAGGQNWCRLPASCGAEGSGAQSQSGDHRAKRTPRAGRPARQVETKIRNKKCAKTI